MKKLSILILFFSSLIFANQVIEITRWLAFDSLEEWSKGIIKLEGHELSSESEVMQSYARFVVNVESSKFDENYFSDIKTLEKLSGTKFEATGQHSYISTYRPFIGMKVSSDVIFTFPSDITYYQNLLNIQIGEEDKVIHQRMSNFSDYAEFSQLIIVIKNLGSNKSLFHIFSLGVLKEDMNDSAFLGFVKKGMAKKVRKQTKISFDHFSKN